MPKLTKYFIDSLKPDKTDFVRWNDTLAGFSVRMRPSGRKSYIVKSRCRGRQIKMTI